MVGGDPRCCELLLYNRAQLGIADENGWQEIHQVLLTRPGGAGGCMGGLLDPEGAQGSGTPVQGARAPDAGVLTEGRGGSSMVPKEEKMRASTPGP